MNNSYNHYKNIIDINPINNKYLSIEYKKILLKNKQIPITHFLNDNDSLIQCNLLLSKRVSFDEKKKIFNSFIKKYHNNLVHNILDIIFSNKKSLTKKEKAYFLDKIIKCNYYNYKIIKYKNITSDIIVKLSKSKIYDLHVRCEICNNEKTPIYLLKKFYKTANFEEKISLSRNKNIPKDIVKNLILENYYFINNELIRNKNIAPSLLLYISKNIDNSLIGNLILHENMSFRLMKSILKNNKNIHLDIISCEQCCIKKFGLSKYNELLLFLSKIGNIKVKHYIAKSDYATHYILNKLSKNKSISLKKVIIKNNNISNVLFKKLKKELCLS